MKRSLRSIIFEVHPDDASSGSWKSLITFALLGALLLAIFGYAFMALTMESGETLPPMIFSGLMAFGGLFMFTGTLVEMTKKLIYKVPTYRDFRAPYGP
ncbi:MAG: hypothetical protein AAB601_01750 [Patescibacteria group bacterium]